MDERRINGSNYINRQPSNAPKRKVANNVRKSQTPYIAKSNISRNKKRNLAQKAKLRLASTALAAGILIGGGAPTLISTLAKNFNSAQDSKQAIEIANEYDDFIASIEQNSKITSKDDLESLKQLENAIQRYTVLKYKTDKTFAEEQEFLDVCKTICESKMLVIDTYTDSIKSKIAEAYDIKDPKEIDSIEVADYRSLDKGNGVYGHKREIELPGYISITEHPITTSQFDYKMPKKLAEHVTNARALLDVDYDFNEMKVEDLPVDQIIDTFQEALKFDDYQISLDEDGNLSIELIEQEKEQNQPEQEDDDRDI